MTLSDYQRLAARTAGGSHREERSILGLAGEAGEVAECRKKMLRGDYDERAYRERLRGELGDVLWYLAECCTAHDLSLHEVAQANIDKLASRAERGVIQGSGSER